MIKKMLAAAALMGSLAMVASEASAASASYCNQVATNYMKQYSHPVGAAVTGCVVGGLFGQILSNGNGGAIAGGCAVGAGTGLVLSDAKRRQLYDDAFNNCMYGGGSQQVNYGPGPAPTGLDGGYVVGSSDWMYACGSKYKSFQMSGPNAGQFKKQVNPTVWSWCNLPG